LFVVPRCSAVRPAAAIGVLVVILAVAVEHEGHQRDAECGCRGDAQAQREPARPAQAAALESAEGPQREDHGYEQQRVEADKRRKAARDALLAALVAGGMEIAI